MGELVRADRAGRRKASGGWIFRDVDLLVSSGDRILLGGPSGAGKTLLLRALALLDPLDAGEIRWRGCPVADGQVPAFRTEVAYLHQFRYRCSTR